VPVKCSADELRDAYQPIMESTYQGDFNKSNGLYVTFPDEVEPTMKYEAIIAITIFSVVALFVIFGTIVDRTDIFGKQHVPVPTEEEEDENRRRESVSLQNKSKIGLFFSSFSIPRNFGRIFIDNFSMQKELKIFNGLFVVSFVLLVLNNVYFVGAMYGIVENAKFSDYEHKIPEFILLRIRLVYEIFYFSIGFTSCVKIWTNYYNHDKTENAAFEILRYVYRRFIPQAFLMMGTLFLFEYFGHGPLYEFCYKHWILGAGDYDM